MKKIKISFILKESITLAFAEESNLTRDELFEDKNLKAVTEAFIESFLQTLAQKMDVEVIEED